MRASLGLAFAATFFGVPAPGPSSIVFDGAEPSRLTDVAYAFHCAGTRTSFAYREINRLPTNDEDFATARIVALVELSMSDRQIARRDLDSIRDRLATLGWVEKVEVSCYEGYVSIFVRGMPIKPFLAFVMEEIDQRPSPEIITFHIAKDGSLEIT